MVKIVKCKCKQHQTQSFELHIGKTHTFHLSLAEIKRLAADIEKVLPSPAEEREGLKELKKRLEEHRQTIKEERDALAILAKDTEELMESSEETMSHLEDAVDSLDAVI